MFIPEFTITQKVLKNIASIEYNSAIVSNTKILQSWKKQLVKDVISNRIYSILEISGSVFSKEKIKEQIDEFAASQIPEVENIKQAINYILEGANKTELEELDIKYVNKILNENLVPKNRTAAYRTHKIEGKPNPEEILAKMVQLFDWYNSLDAKENHPFITSSIMLAELIRIEPFENMNYATATLSADLVLSSFGKNPESLYEIDSYLSRSQKEMESLLSEISDTEVDYTSWLEFVTDAISIETYGLSEKIKLLAKDTKVAKVTGRVKVSQRQERLIEYLQDFGLLQNKDFTRVFPDISEDTVLRDLKALIEKGLVKKAGSTKSSYYELS